MAVNYIMAFDPTNPSYAPPELPAPLPPKVALKPPMKGTASPWERVDGQNRDRILEAIRQWGRDDLLAWAERWLAYFDAYTNGQVEWLEGYMDDVAEYLQGVAKGTEGIQGPPGPAGPRGIDGVQGPRGLQGPAGPAGADGATGPAGPQGPRGEAGVAGPAGADGAVGPRGVDGLPGPAGAAGPTGPAGPAGDTGPEGPRGASGLFNTWMASTLLPPLAGEISAGVASFETTDQIHISNSANDGTEYGNLFAMLPTGTQISLLDTSDPEAMVRYETTDVFYRNDGSSVVTVNVLERGPSFIAEGENISVFIHSPVIPGPAGPQGLRGATGPAGPIGPRGLVGPAGADGRDGAQGPVGPAGPAGRDGAQGDAGPQGPRGDAGAAGETGPEGTQGVPGPTGPQGVRGPQGPAGQRGTGGLYDEWVVASLSAATMGTLVLPSSDNGILVMNNVSNLGSDFGGLFRLPLIGSYLNVQDEAIPDNWVQYRISAVRPGDSITEFDVTFVDGARTAIPAGARVDVLIAIPGARGDKGDKGDRGEQGPVGPGGTGSIGPVGPQGPAGPKGDKGDKGDPGEGQSVSPFMTYTGVPDYDVSAPGKAVLTGSNGAILGANEMSQLTTLQLAYIDSDNIRRVPLFGTLKMGDQIIIQDSADQTRYGRWEITQSPEFNPFTNASGGVVLLRVRVLTVGPGGYPNATNALWYQFLPQTAGPVGPQGPEGARGQGFYDEWVMQDGTPIAGGFSFTATALPPSAASRGTLHISHFGALGGNWDSLLVTAGPGSVITVVRKSDALAQIRFKVLAVVSNASQMATFTVQRLLGPSPVRNVAPSLGEQAIITITPATPESDPYTGDWAGSPRVGFVQTGGVFGSNIPEGMLTSTNITLSTTSLNGSFIQGIAKTLGMGTMLITGFSGGAQVSTLCRINNVNSTAVEVMLNVTRISGDFGYSLVAGNPVWSIRFRPVA